MSGTGAGSTADPANISRTLSFSANAPRLKLSRDLKPQTAKDRQNGYMRMFEGSMIGPRAHTAAHPDDAQTALELVALCSHLVRVTRGAVRTRQRNSKTP